MRFLHTSDWHLGRIFHGLSLLDEQRYVLEHLRLTLRDSDAEALFISGDVFDRAIPPVEAVELLDDFLSEVVLGLELPVVMISGNHDSPERLGFGSRLLTARGLHVLGVLGTGRNPILLRDEHGTVEVYGVPYSDPPMVRDSLKSETVVDHESAMRETLSWMKAGRDPHPRRICLAHAFVAGGAESESERPLSIAGAGTIPCEVFSEFCYTALGHLHRPQSVGNPRVQYSGSLLRYSFSEVTHEKSYNLVELDEKGEARVQRIPVTVRRTLRRIEGELAALLQAAPDDPRPQDFLLVALTDDGPVLDPMGKLRPYYPNVLAVERAVRRESGVESRGESVKRRQHQSESELYASFFADVTGEPLSPEQEATIREVLGHLTGASS